MLNALANFTTNISVTCTVYALENRKSLREKGYDNEILQRLRIRLMATR